MTFMLVALGLNLLMVAINLSTGRWVLGTFNAAASSALIVAVVLRMVSR